MAGRKALCGDFFVKTIAALFDVDGTLFTGHVWRGTLDYFEAQGHVTLLVSTAFTKMVAEIGKTIGAEYAVGCDLEMKDGRATGRIVPPVVIGKQKGIAAKAKLSALGHESARSS